MSYSVYQHWDPLKTAIVGATYPPQLYDYITNEKVRKVFYRIAEETEEDYQKLIRILNKFNVEILRPEMGEVNEFNNWCVQNKQTIPKPLQMQPRDYTIMIGKTFYASNEVKGFENIIKHVKAQGNSLGNKNLYRTINGAMTTRVGKDLYIGTEENTSKLGMQKTKEFLQFFFQEHRITMVNTEGHTDGTFCPVCPGLLLTIKDFDGLYDKTFPNWEVISIPGEAWNKIIEFRRLKWRNKGKWWVPGEELNQDFTDFVEIWMNKWVGYVEESVFDINMLVIDRHNVIVNGYNDKIFDALSRYNITPHICNFRHRYFWDGGLHCITSDLNREGVMQDYFPERINTSY